MPRPHLLRSLTRLQSTPSLLTLTLYSEMQRPRLRVGFAAAALALAACLGTPYVDGVSLDFLNNGNCSNTPHGGTCKPTCAADSGYIGKPSATCNDGLWDYTRGCVQGEPAPHLLWHTKCCRQCREV